MADLAFPTPPAVCPVCGSAIASSGDRRRGYGCGLELLARSTWPSLRSDSGTGVTWMVSRPCGEAMERAMQWQSELDELRGRFDELWNKVNEERYPDYQDKNVADGMLPPPGMEW